MKKIALASLVLFAGIGFYTTDAHANACGDKAGVQTTQRDGGDATSRGTHDGPTKNQRSGEQKDS